MKTTIEISNYPLTLEYEVQILDFIDRIKQNPSIQVKVNTTSTRLVDDYG